MKESSGNFIFWQSLWRDLLFFGSVLAFVAFSVAHFSGKKKDLLSLPGNDSSSKAGQSTSLPTNSSSSPVPELKTENRSLASVQTGNPSTHSFPLGCWKALESKKMETSALLVQLQWEKCEEKAAKTRAFRAKNTATGEALLLLENSSGFFTHYFPVKEGKNEIVIETGSESRTLEILRN